MRLSHIRPRRRFWWGPIVLAALIAVPGVARAQTPSQGHLAPTSGATERQKLRTQLQRINAEIDALKRDKRGLADDYRIRQRMADAEALARRLTDLDARTGTSDRAGRDATWPAAPEARSSDDRADLEAKADILSDQARRLDAQANVLAERVTTLRGRQELRRRAGQLERDPFSPLEQVKRRTAIARAPGATESAGGPGPARTNDQAGGGTPVVSPPTTPAVGGTTPPAGGTTTTPGASGIGTTGVGAATSTDQTARASSTSTTAGLNTPPAALPMGPVTAGDTAGSVASQFRGMLDAATLAEIRKLEVPGSPTGSLQAMERALSALRARAAQLAGNASALRVQAKAAR